VQRGPADASRFGHFGEGRGRVGDEYFSGHVKQ
jgi:hypothetical protein